MEGKGRKRGGDGGGPLISVKSRAHTAASPHTIQLKPASIIIIRYLCFISDDTVLTLCSEKKTPTRELVHTPFFPYLQEWCVDLNINCSEYT